MKHIPVETGIHLIHNTYRILNCCVCIQYAWLTNSNSTVVLLACYVTYKEGYLWDESKTSKMGFHLRLLDVGNTEVFEIKHYSCNRLECPLPHVLVLCFDNN